VAVAVIVIVIVPLIVAALVIVIAPECVFDTVAAPQSGDP
jgi:hypothetical protein